MESHAYCIVRYRGFLDLSPGRKLMSLHTGGEGKDGNVCYWKWPSQGCWTLSFSF